MSAKKIERKGSAVRQRREGAATAGALAYRARRRHGRLPGGPRDGNAGPQRGAGNRDRLRAALQAALLHGERDPRPDGGQEFAEHAAEEQTHADQIVERIIQLGGAPDLNPDGLLSRSHSEYVEGEGLLEMIKEDLVADPTTRRLMEGILAKEEKHADDMRSLLERLGSEKAAGP